VAFTIYLFGITETNDTTLFTTLFDGGLGDPCSRAEPTPLLSPKPKEKKENCRMDAMDHEA
jgi:hypothetical protein